MIYSGILHYADQRDAFFLEDGRLRIRLSTAHGDMRSVILHCQDKYIPQERLNTKSQVEMDLFASDFSRDYYKADLTIPETAAGNPDTLCLRYYFELTDVAGAKIWYGDSRLFAGEPDDVEAMFDCPLISRKELTFREPDWAKSAVVYQVFPSRYATTENIPDDIWYKAPIGAKDDLHGNLKGITMHLPHLKELGVDVVYMTPIFKSNTTHKYDTVDYYEVDPEFGTSDDLHELIDKAHELNMRVVLDGVFNHTSPDFFAFKDIVKNGRDSDYFNWYYVDSLPPDAGSHDRKPSYQSFAYFGGMPKLNLKNPAVADYICKVAEYYLKEFHIDGWRLDVGDEIGHEFWKQFRKRMKAVNPDALLVGEVWHYAPDFLQGDEWDSVMNYTFFKSVATMVLGNGSPSEFLAELGFLNGQYHSAVIPVLWNLIDSHDTSRFLYRAGEDIRKLRLAASLQMLLPGTPFIYYGDEVGMTGGEDPDNRRGMLWDEKRQNKEMYQWYQRLTYFRHMIKAIPEGDYRFIKADDRKGNIEFHLTSGETLLFHVNDKTASAREYEGCTELLSDKTFDGELPPYSTVLLR